MITLLKDSKTLMKSESLITRPKLVVLAALAKSEKLDGKEKEAILASESALNYDKEFVPAAIIRTQLISDVKSQRKAISLIESFCRRTLHPKVLEEYIKLWPNEDALQKYQRLQNGSRFR